MKPLRLIVLPALIISATLLSCGDTRNIPTGPPGRPQPIQPPQ
ncbi:MAG: hypothetical protein RML40_07015 [Bacteroidota bacterium]|nr:hypothetical protein [Candidatus Kapabacteria bacterium]MDW8220267.1 hypothetical protein [Bacteroidota bacterium]